MLRLWSVSVTSTTCSSLHEPEQRRRLCPFSSCRNLTRNSSWSRAHWAANINPDTTFKGWFQIELVACNQEGILPASCRPTTRACTTSGSLPSKTFRTLWLDVTLSVPNAGSTFDLASLIQPGPNGAGQVTAEILAAHVDGLPRFLLDPSIGPSAYDLNPDLSVSSSALNSYLDNVATELSTGASIRPTLPA